MRAHTCWDNRDRTVVRCEMLHGWTWDDLSRVMLRTERLMHEQNRSLALILDLRDAEALSPDRLFSLKQMTAGRTFARLSACFPQPFVIVGATPMIRAIFSHYYIACSVDTTHLHFSPTLDDARKWIADAQRRQIVFEVVESA
jgi:hypothetical protein